MSRRALACALLVGVVALAPARPAAAVELDDVPLRARLAFQWADHEYTNDGSITTGRGLSTIDLTGGDEQRLTDPTPGQDGQPSWSPDGRHLLFGRYEERGVPDYIGIIDASGGEPRELASGFGPAWSPDGGRIAYLVGRDDAAEIVVVDIEHVGDTWQLVANTERRFAVPWAWTTLHWSPGGDRLAFTVQADVEGRWPMSCEVWTLEPDTGEIVRVTTFPELEVMCGKAVFSPSARYLAFEVGDLETMTSGNTYIVGADGSNPHPALPGTTHDHGYGWSPAGDVLAVISPGARGITIVNPVAGTLHSFWLDNHSSVLQVGWTPAATHLIIQGQRWDGPGSFGAPTHYWTVPAAGGEPQQLTDAAVLGSEFAVLSPGFAVRTFGMTRIETAIALSRTAFERAEVAVLAPASEAAHALVAGPLAADLGGPLLLTYGDGLEPAVAAELRRLGVSEVWLVGDDTVLPTALEVDLAAAGVTNVERIDEATAAGIALVIAERLGGDRAYIVRVDEGPIGWPDAVSVAGLAAEQQRPILLVGQSSVPSPTRDAIRAGARTLVIVGGSAAIADAVADELRDAGASVERVAGRDRYETSRLVAARAETAGMDATRPFLASGQSWADSVAAGPAAAATGRVLLLVDGDDPESSTATSAWLDDRGDDLLEVGVVGGGAAIAPEVEAALEALVG